jgi:hypothetical protein
VENVKLTRRSSLLGITGFLFGLLGWKASDSDGAGPAAVASGAVSCVLTAEQTEGPYYITGEKLRRNITEGRAGVPLLLRLRVVGRLDVQADPARRGRHLACGRARRLLGVRLRRQEPNVHARDPEDRCERARPLPYGLPGLVSRTYRAHPREGARRRQRRPHGAALLPGSLTDRVFRRKPYSRRPHRTTRNASDFVFAQGGRRSMLKLRRVGGAYVGSITMGVHRS